MGLGFGIRNGLGYTGDGIEKACVSTRNSNTVGRDGISLTRASLLKALKSHQMVRIRRRWSACASRDIIFRR